MIFSPVLRAHRTSHSTKTTKILPGRFFERNYYFEHNQRAFSGHPPVKLAYQP
ncbi:hypothetical protein PILCRDRAFT_818872 [Piloderma croceum F 1598]|uniref:Uncharacterized protein n=1 Tax=Piloderma croceum (strain F 1598) TaxID=765440 RepID=A0A0C3FW96_PILCF|nr:hypothetical protein PILCRDRAFT_818872 [Piloderma croceum F 1598]